MKLRMVRFAHGVKDTLGYLRIGTDFECFTLEDEYRTRKVLGKTRIPEGHYELKLRAYGETHEKYRARYGDWHKGMLELLNVRNFSDILIHCGNTEEDTAGCILVGDGLNSNREGRGSLIHSRKAYERLYPVVAERLSLGVYCEIGIISE